MKEDIIAKNALQFKIKRGLLST